MILARKLMMAAVSPPIGQQIFSVAGWSSFIVPAGVFSICIVCVGSGGYSIGSEYGGGCGGGGACAWTNNIAVTPGETLNIQVGRSSDHGDDLQLGTSFVRRGASTYLVFAVPGRPYVPTASPGFYNDGIGGPAADCVGVNRISGLPGDNSVPRGGSAAYHRGTPIAPADRGGYGISYGSTSCNVTTPSAFIPQNRQGASAGGGACAYNAGSYPTLSGGSGVVCIIWGPGRGFSAFSNDY